MRLAIVGCGAIAELGYLPAMALARDVEVTLLVDRDVARAKLMAERFGVSHFSRDVGDVSRFADAACVALPHHLHEPIGQQLLEAGVHLLMEKPLAVTVEECDALISSAARHGRILSVAMPRRYSYGNLLAKNLLSSSLLGVVRSFFIESGSAEVWPARSAHLLSRRESGGGVLMGNGCHDLDLITWLFGAVSAVRCFSDSKMGVEANFTIDLTTGTGVEGAVELSRTRTLKNRLLIHAERATLEIPLLGDNVKFTFSGDRPMALSGRALTIGQQKGQDNNFLRIMAAQLDNFAAAVEGRERPTVDGATARATVDLIRSCYAMAGPMTLAWRRDIWLPRGSGSHVNHKL